MKQKLFKLILVLGMPVLMLFVLEMGLRFVQSGSLYLAERCPHVLKEPGLVVLVPGFRGWWHGAHYEINANGFRMPEDVAATTNQLRILALGDSVTEGYCIPDVRKTWPMRLEDQLNQAGLDTYVINAGVAGWNLLVLNPENEVVSGQFSRFLGDDAPHYQPDLIIYTICINDVPGRANNLFEIDNRQNKERFPLIPESWRHFFKRKAFYRLARDWYRERRFYSLDFSTIPTPDMEPAFWRQVEDEFVMLKELAGNMGAGFACIIWPYSYQLLPANRDLLQINDQITSILERLDIPHRDLTTELTAEEVLQYYVIGDYIHPNVRGHQMIADAARDLAMEMLPASSKAKAR